MPLRLLEITIPPQASRDVLDDVVADLDTSRRSEQKLECGSTLVSLVVDTKNTETIIDHLEQKYSDAEEFRIVVLPVEAVIPRLPEDEKPTTDSEGKRPSERVSREELYAEISQSAGLSHVFMAQVVLSTIVAAVGLIRNDVAVIIGAMVIAPLLGPNVALALATTLGDIKLACRSLKTNVVGVSIALALSITTGVFLTVDPTSASIATRTNVGISDIVLALASGIAGVLAFTSGAPSSLVGVMVAVALLPPLVVFGLLTAAGNYTNAIGALGLVTTNLICVNLAGVFTFYIQGVRPRTWWEAKRAKQATRISLAIWTILLAILGVIILFAAQ